jgi:hypothetical protein
LSILFASAANARSLRKGMNCPRLSRQTKD